MPKFVFNLQAVLRQRKGIEQQRQRELGEANGELRDVEAEVEGLNGAVRDVTQDMRDRLVGKLDMNFLVAHRRFMLGMQRKGTALVQRLIEAQKKVEEARALLAEAARQRRVLEKMRERHFEQWKANLSAKEATEMDEIGMQLSYWHASDA